MNAFIHINPRDVVAVALETVPQGTVVSVAGFEGTALQEIPRGHKIALRDIAQGEPVIKYGYPIGIAKENIPAGSWVHTHNVRTGLSDEGEFVYKPNFQPLAPKQAATFQGYLRPDGRAAIRNELWVIPLVGCVNGIAEKIVRENQHLVQGSIDGLYTFPHPYGCSQTGDDHVQTRKLLSALARHPNAGGVLLLGLGCENNTLEDFQNELGSHDNRRYEFLICQDVEDEYEEGAHKLKALAEYAAGFERQPLPASKLVVGLKCGGSDGLSGITGNPTVGRFSDILVAQGGSTILTEVPEMFGAENVLLERCINEDIFNQASNMMVGFKHYFTDHGQPVYENPSPGNKKGGITTLEDKSLGCVQKGGTAPVVGVIDYANQLKTPGLNLLRGPGNDLVSTTALTAAGAHMILFTTGRGTPFGAPVPTMKISTNSAIAEKKPNWIDFNTGVIVDGEPIDETAQRLFDLVLETASGKETCTERSGFREISIFKDGVIL